MNVVYREEAARTSPKNNMGGALSDAFFVFVWIFIATILLLNISWFIPPKEESIYPQSPTIGYELLLSKSHPEKGISKPLDGFGALPGLDFNQRIGCLVSDARVRAIPSRFGGTLVKGKTGQRVSYMVSSISRPDKGDDPWVFAGIKFGNTSRGGWIKGSDILFLEGAFQKKRTQSVEEEHEIMSNAAAKVVANLPEFARSNVLRTSTPELHNKVVKLQNEEKKYKGSMVAPVEPSEHLGDRSTIPVMCDLDMPQIKTLLRKQANDGL